MLDPGVKARETADCETPASAATSKEVARDRLILLDMPVSTARRILRIQRLPATRSLTTSAEKLPELGRCFNRFYCRAVPITDATWRHRAIDSPP
jgi:hypothetical protein